MKFILELVLFIVIILAQIQWLEDSIKKKNKTKQKTLESLSGVIAFVFIYK